MECNCFDADVDDYAIILSDTMPIARKKHKCSECKRTISIGEKYRKETTLFDAKFDLAKTCLDCNSIRTELVCGFYWGEVLTLVKEGIYDNCGEISESAMTRLTPRARGMICEWLEEYWLQDE